MNNNIVVWTEENKGGFTTDPILVDLVVLEDLVNKGEIDAEPRMLFSLWLCYLKIPCLEFSNALYRFLESEECGSKHNIRDAMMYFDLSVQVFTRFSYKTINLIRD